MSKCEKKYELIMATRWDEDNIECKVWQAAWNARGKVDAEICRMQANEPECPERATYCAKAIEQEQCK